MRKFRQLMERFKQLPFELRASLVVIFVSIILAIISPCSIIFLLPICIATVALSLFRIWSERRQARAVSREVGGDPAVAIRSEGHVDDGTVVVQKIGMDGAACWRASNGGVLIKKRTARNWFALIFLGLFELGFVAAIVNALVNDDWLNFQSQLGSLIVLVGLTLATGIPLVVLVRVMRIPSIRVDVNLKTIKLGRGSSARQIPFANVEQVIISHFPPLSGQNVIRIDIMLDGGDLVTLGTVSGDDAEMVNRATTIAQWIAAAVGAPGPGM